MAQPPVSWAQRKDCTYITVSVPEAKDLHFSFENQPAKFKLTCTSSDGKVKYNLDFDLFEEIVKEVCYNFCCTILQGKQNRKANTK